MKDKNTPLFSFIKINGSKKYVVEKLFNLKMNYHRSKLIIFEGMYY